MKCPFCASNIEGKAVVCRSCRRDISFSKPIMEENARLGREVEKLNEEIEKLKRSIAEPRDALARVERASELLMIYLALPILALISWHVFFVIFLDANLLWLRFATLLTAAGFGGLFESRRSPRWMTKFSFALAIAAFSVFGMSLIIYFLYAVPLRSDLTESLEYAASIALAFFLGSLVVLIMRSMHFLEQGKESDLAGSLGEMLARHIPYRKDISLQERIDHWVLFVRGIEFISTVAAVLFSGFRHFHLSP
jgi:hypothetical protein